MRGKEANIEQISELLTMIQTIQNVDKCQPSSLITECHIVGVDLTVPVTLNMPSLCLTEDSIISLEFLLKVSKKLS